MAEAHKKLSDAERRERVHELMEHFDTAMLVTRMLDGRMRSRPLAIADKRDDGTLYFSTAIESGKVHELEHDPNVNVVLQDKRRYVSISGEGRILRDRALVDELWSESWRIWFPGGKDDPSLAIVAVEPSEAWYWDAAGVEGIRYVFEMAKGYVTGKRPASDQDDRHTGHVKI
jgi:general stress protein 26